MSRLLEERSGERIEILSTLIVTRKGYYTKLSEWAQSRGISHLRVDGEMLPTDNWPRIDRYREHSIEAPVGTFVVKPGAAVSIRKALKTAFEIGAGTALILSTNRETQLVSTRSACGRCSLSFPDLNPKHFSYNSHLGWCPTCTGAGRRGIDNEGRRPSSPSASGAASEEPCPECNGSRINPEARSVLLHGTSIAELSALPVTDLARRIDSFDFDGREARIARDVLTEIARRIAFLEHVGIGYLSLDRGAPSLSGGEAQRIRLAAQLGSNLKGVCYVLDEPTIGLHPRDTERLLETLVDLRSKGNTVVVVEHDVDTILKSDHVIDLGPGAGVSGGEVVAKGTPGAITRSKRSVTGRYLAASDGPRYVSRGAAAEAGELVISRASRHNLKHIDVAIPLERFVCVTGVSGSGKSTLVRDVVLATLHGEPWTHRRVVKPVGCDDISGFGGLKRVREVDQAPIGKTPRSCVATYVGIWTHIRRLFADVTEARMRAFTPGRFSFNTAEGRCPVCRGQGYERVEMSFLPEVRVACDVCNGHRFDEETLSVKFKEKTVFDVLEMEVEEAASFFAFHPKIHAILATLSDLGLGYLSLGQQSPTLSGGEAQRIKLVTELAKTAGPNISRTPNRTLYLLDEPTIGLHMADVERLIRVLHRFVDAGHTLVVIEHNLDVIASADWIVDLGPEGGSDGGFVVAGGVPEEIAAKKNTSHTGRYLSSYLARRRSRTS